MGAHTPIILFEDNHLLIVHKPFGMPSQGDETGDESVFDWAKNYIKDKYQKEGNVYVALLHRIDRPTGGILMLGKTSKAASRISEDFQKNLIQKTYYAVTENIPEPAEGELRHYLGKVPNKNIVRAYNKPVREAKAAHLTYKVLATNGKRALIEVRPHTGRQHQIRVQLAAIGCVICGDVKYGKTDFLPDKSIALLAQSITFMHPTKKEPMTISVLMPNSHVWGLFADKFRVDLPIV